MEERELIERAKNGDERAFNELYKRYRETVFNFSYNVCHNKDYAEEVVQDTFVNVFRKLHQYDGRAKFSTWLYSIVVNNCQMHNRRTKLEQATVSIDELRRDDEESDQSIEMASVEDYRPDVIYTNNELREALHRALQKLPLDYRLPFILRELEGLSNEEAASVLGLSVPAFKSRLHRARTFIRTELSDFAS
ncbi:MAG: sigma-70 family RNA polymerase sigma factor [Bacteroidota bacterium]|nr:sigma-70 family RNA polymerase sigma factor [Candidatus Kapabacteria bacterium]MCS7303349.1 sigma-70 family RNA polymerase sigma factor [Candidatus Kapabacteria bacterium]MCX7937350.1 sigma-70 family RNA polymerase sigma factor [Chlorobiota bacterium]MDW8075873.1 sigma-70 family RNA polymerase sigma factor [Bacteroidota bacterium]MDW8271807.1 sigma-70 family RNA polymerase sigma factor [Bacteroidota bacterium]